MKWKPDLTPEEFQNILSYPTHPPLQPYHASGLQEGAWWWDGKELWVRVPWRRYTWPPSPEGMKVFGQVIKAHDTHLLIKDRIHPIHNTILDVGGYDGIWAWLFEADLKIVLDVCQEALERWAAIHAGIVCIDAKELEWLYSPETFDVVFLLDVLEHMEEESALAAIEAAEEIAIYQVLVATPDGYQPFDDWQSIVTKDSDVPCAELMAHKSGWGHGFFQDRGYEVIIQPDLHTDIGGGDGLVAILNK